MYNTYIVYRMDIANRLLDQGFKLVRIAVNKRNPKYTIYHFIDSEEIRQATKEILENSSRNNET